MAQPPVCAFLILEREAGITPAFPAGRAGVFCLHYSRKFWSVVSVGRGLDGAGWVAAVVTALCRVPQAPGGALSNFVPL